MVRTFLMSLTTTLTLLLSAITLAAEQPPLNPNFIYFSNGQTPDAWHWVLSDPGNWWQPIDANEGKSSGGKVTMSSAATEQFPGAIKLKWDRRDNWGAAAISGRTVDLSKFEHAAELMVAIKVESRVPHSVKVKMMCGEGCEAEVDVADNLREMPRGQWMALPLALDCFAANGVDLSKVTSPFSVGSSGALELHIAEISLGSMVAGDQGCVPNEPATP
ncbi:putative glycoside hydrolase [Gilvimarinus polysaccharolyticus]|uniref:putative glycoside hydrolase n=1 Tax=Gilvimarinus polysaccharolyticus TaxID=863921 RepID=UPI000673517B|nr:putative glycoside hydrolase [Gilvimarinus polysaccharolyticus]